MGWRVTVSILFALAVAGCAQENNTGEPEAQKTEATRLTLDQVLSQTLAAGWVGEYLCPMDNAAFHTVHITEVSSGDAEHLDFDMADMMETCEAGASADQKSCQGTMMMGDMERRFSITNLTSETITFKLQVVAQ